MPGFGVQRLDEPTGKWQTVIDSNDADFCQPTLGMGSTKLVTKWLWPGAVLSIGEEAIAAREPLRKGDIVRYVVYQRMATTARRPFPPNVS
jgi:hypothetical protein